MTNDDKRPYPCGAMVSRNARLWCTKESDHDGPCDFACDRHATNDDKSAPVRPVGPMGLIDECNCGGLGDGDSFSHDEDCPEGERLVRAYEEERDAPPAQPVTGCGKRMGGGLAPLKCGERTELRTVLCIDCLPAQPVTDPQHREPWCGLKIGNAISVAGGRVRRPKGLWFRGELLVFCEDICRNRFKTAHGLFGDAPVPVFAENQSSTEPTEMLHADMRGLYDSVPAQPVREQGEAQEVHSVSSVAHVVLKVLEESQLIGRSRKATAFAVVGALGPLLDLGEPVPQTPAVSATWAEYHRLLNLLCSQLRVPGSPTFEEALGYVKDKLFAQQLPSVLPVETPPDVLIAALSDTVDRLPFVVEQRDGDRVWMLRFPGGERQAREATYAEAMLWLALRIERLERRDRGAPHTFEAGPLVKPTPQYSPTAGPGPDDGDDDDCEEDPLTGQLVSATVGRPAAPPTSTGEPAGLCSCGRVCALRDGLPYRGRCRENAPDVPAAAPPRKTPGELAREAMEAPFQTRLWLAIGEYCASGDGIYGNVRRQKAVVRVNDVISWLFTENRRGDQ